MENLDSMNRLSAYVSESVSHGKKNTKYYELPVSHSDRFSDAVDKMNSAGIVNLDKNVSIVVNGLASIRPSQALKELKDNAEPGVCWYVDGSYFDEIYIWLYYLSKDKKTGFVASLQYALDPLRNNLDGVLTGISVWSLPSGKLQTFYGYSVRTGIDTIEYGMLQ